MTLKYTMQQTISDLTTPLFNVYRILRTLNTQKMVVLDQVPRFLEAPFSYMPRNYLSSPELCQVQFHRSTTYPWGMLLVGSNEAKYFPPFTPVVPMPVEYVEANYDRTLVSMRGWNSIVTSEKQMKTETKPKLFDIPPATDYQNQIQPDQIKQVQRLSFAQDMMPKWHATTRQNHRQEGSLCRPGARIVYQFAATPEQFYESNRNNEPTPYAPSTDVVKRYQQYLESTATESPQLQQQQQQQQQQQPKVEAMEIEPEPEDLFPTLRNQPDFSEQFER